MKPFHNPFNQWKIDHLRLCLTINNCPKLFLSAMTLAMNTMTGRIPSQQFYVLEFIMQIFVVNQMIAQAVNPNYLRKSEQGVQFISVLTNNEKTWSGSGKCEKIFIFSNLGLFSSNLVIKIPAILTTKSVTLTACVKQGKAILLTTVRRLPAGSRFKLSFFGVLSFLYNRN